MEFFFCFIFVFIINNFLILLHVGPAVAVRCYTDLQKTKSLSVECGLNTACVKIFKKSPGSSFLSLYLTKDLNKNLFSD